MELREGDVYTHERTFTEDDVRAFADLSEDRQSRHTDPDDGRLMVHGLLTATLPTKIGGDLEVLASRIDLRFRRPVYTGQRVRCRWRNDEVFEREDRYEVTVGVTCTVAEETVLEGTVEGVVWKEE